MSKPTFSHFVCASTGLALSTVGAITWASIPDNIPAKVVASGIAAGASTVLHLYAINKDQEIENEYEG